MEENSGPLTCSLFPYCPELTPCCMCYCQIPAAHKSSLEVQPLGPANYEFLVSKSVNYRNLFCWRMYTNVPMQCECICGSRRFYSNDEVEL